MPVLNPKALLQNRVHAIRKMHADAGILRAELDLSGGIDSAALAGLLVIAQGAENVTLAHLAINSNPVQTARAIRLANALGCKLAVGDFTESYNTILAEIKRTLQAAGFDMAEIEARLAADPTILGSVRSCLRAPLGRGYNRITGGGIRHGTGNECEDRFLRFYQKGGDGEVDSNPIAMLSKAEVYQLCFELGETLEGYNGNTGAKAAYAETIGAIPSADLWGNGDTHNDESEIKNWTGAAFTYGKLDPDTGKVYKIGTIERVARFLDENVSNIILDCKTNEDVLFGDTLSQEDMRDLLGRAVFSDAFKDAGLGYDQLEALLKGARKAEKQTRHKLNPNIPQLGCRTDLVMKGILSDNFADYGI